MIYIFTCKCSYLIIKVSSSSYIPKLNCLLYERHCLVHSVSTFCSAALAVQIDSHSIGISSFLFSLYLEDTGRILRLTCSPNYFKCMISLSITHQLSCRPVLCFILVHYFSRFALLEKYNYYFQLTLEFYISQ